MSFLKYLVVGVRSDKLAERIQLSNLNCIVRAVSVGISFC